MAEFVGTALLLATVVGSGIMAERLAGGNEAIALLGNTLPTGGILIVLILMFGPISGAHFNPAVTLAILMRKEISLPTAFAYLGVQIVGGIFGTLLAHAMFDIEMLQSSVHMRTGPGQWLSEVVATFGLIATILLTRRIRLEAVAVSVGLYISAAYWFTASTSFANPAVTIARTMTDTFSGIRPADAPLFILAQLAGAAMAATICAWMVSPIEDPK